SFNIKVLGNNNLIKKEIIKEINKIANEEIKKIKGEYNKIIKKINEEYKKKINELKKTIKDKVLLNYKINELTKERDKKLKEEKERLNERIKDILDERNKVIDELKKIETPVICPPLEIHPDDWCKDGKIVSGKKDANGCKLKDKCVKCPVWPPKQCKDGGKLVPGGFDQNGCKAPDKCIIEGITTTSTSSTSTSTSTTTTSSSTSTSSTTIPGVIITTTTTSTSSSTSTVPGIGIMIIEGETGRKVNETILYFSDIIVESDRTNITIEELGLGEYEEKEAEEQVSYEGIYNLVLFILVILILLYLQYRKKKLNIFVLSLVIGYAILTLILLLYNLGRYFVFGNIVGLNIIIYQVYLLIRSVSKKTLLNSLYYKVRGFFVRLREDFERVNKIVLRLFNGFKKRVYHKERGSLVHYLPSGHVSKKINANRNTRLLCLVSCLLFFFSISLYLGLRLEREVFVYGYLVPIFLILFTVFVLVLLGTLLVLVFRFTFWIINKIFYKTNK
ncbi:hypothetical protein HYV88_04050, partial [Candidatus Woesearchaeota archaeon]|nr:hypothetical protein [Candidatus Woesearchaeota archaeon]